MAYRLLSLLTLVLPAICTNLNATRNDPSLSNDAQTCSSMSSCNKCDANSSASISLTDYARVVQAFGQDHAMHLDKTDRILNSTLNSMSNSTLNSTLTSTLNSTLTSTLNSTLPQLLTNLTDFSYVYPVGGNDSRLLQLSVQQRAIRCQFLMGVETGDAKLEYDLALLAFQSIASSCRTDGGAHIYPGESSIYCRRYRVDFVGR